MDAVLIDIKWECCPVLGSFDCCVGFCCYPCISGAVIAKGGMKHNYEKDKKGGPKDLFDLTSYECVGWSLLSTCLPICCPWVHFYSLWLSTSEEAKCGRCCSCFWTGVLPCFYCGPCVQYIELTGGPRSKGDLLIQSTP